jgi:hypothetical protein
MTFAIPGNARIMRPNHPYGARLYAALSARTSGESTKPLRRGRNAAAAFTLFASGTAALLPKRYAPQRDINHFCLSRLGAKH